MSSTVTKERGEADLAKRKRGVPLGSGHSWQRTEHVGRGYSGHRSPGAGRPYPPRWREMKCELLNAAAAAS